MNSYCPYCMERLEDRRTCPVCGRSAAFYVPAGHHLQPGSLLLKRYRIGRVLRENDFSLTYLVLDHLLNRKYMLEECFPRGFVHREAANGQTVISYPGEKERIFERGRDQLLKDARAMAEIGNAPGMVRVFDSFPANHTAYIVMEYLSGETMREQLEKNYLMPGHILLPMMEPVLRAVGLMHGKGIIHCNISPDSIMLQKNRAKLFGTVRNVGVLRDITMRSKTEFSIPELNAGYALGPWTDTYMLCSTIYQDLTGIDPAVVNRRSAGQSELLPPSGLGAALKMKQDMAIMKGLSIRPEDRWQSIDELYDAFYRIKREGLPSKETEAAGYSSPRYAVSSGDTSGSVPAEEIEATGKKGRKWLLPVLGAAIAITAFCSVSAGKTDINPNSEAAGIAQSSGTEARSEEGGISDSRSEPLEDSFGDRLTWSVAGGVLTISGTGDMPDFEPNSDAKSGYVPWREYREEIRTVMLRSGITSVGENAFRDCANLTGVSIPEGVKKIGSFAFYRCRKLERVDLPDGVTDLGSFTFYGCSGLTEITLRDGLNGIGDQTFYHCDRLSAVTIPDGVKSIGSSAFAICSGLESVTIPPTVTYIGGSAFAACVNLREIRIPGAVKQIDSAAFTACARLESVVLQQGTAAIRDNAFHGCGALKELSLPDSIVRIGSLAFSDCRSLTDVFYAGTEKQWKRITIDRGNDALSGALVHYSAS